MKRKSFLLLLIAILFSMCVSGGHTKPASTSVSYANNSQNDIDYSIFIRNPSYSTIFENNLFFYDEYDKLLKVYDTNQSAFLSSTISLTNYDIIDMASHQNTLFFLAQKAEKQYVISICLDLAPETFTFSNPVETELENAFYKRIFATNLTLNGTNRFVLSLTNDVEIEGSKPALLVLSNTYDKVALSNIEFNISGGDETVIDISQNLFKMVVIGSESYSDELLLVFVYKKFVSYTDHIMVSDVLSNSKISINKALSANNELPSSASSYTLNNVNLITISGKSYFYITYQNMVARSNTVSPVLYEYTLDGINKTTFTAVKYLKSLDCNYITTNNDYCIYSTKQTINYIKYSYDSTQEDFFDISRTVLNPEVKINYVSTENIDVRKTKNATSIYSTPWDSSPIKISDTSNEIPANYDVIFLGNGYIESNNVENNVIVKDYVYCLCTINDKNIEGYIKTADLESKQKILPEHYEYSIVKVVPNSNLYIFPTKVLTNTPAENVTVGIIAQIADNSRVEIIDPICRYTANNTTFVKVLVNDSLTGYIDYSNIITPSAYKDFIETNACIKQDNTSVYLTTDSNSPIIYKLNKDFRVRINGARDTKSGYTSITFNDEYGNEFSGYIITDAIGTDNWSSLQIIGCVLIAINIGLLILILMFKKHKIGNNGSKYLGSEKENYKK